MSGSGDKPVVVMMAEDNPADAFFFREAAETGRISIELYVVTDGEEALKFLRKEPPFETAVQPDVAVLDLNLPLKSGREVVAEMASDPVLNRIPVVILTTPASEARVCDLYPTGRCIYFAKTNDFEELQAIIRKIVEHARTALS